MTTTAHTAADPAILKDVINGPIADCRPADVRYVIIHLDVDFQDLCPAASPQDNTTTRCAYYLELPQETVVVNNANDVARNLTTFHGVSNLHSLSAEELCLVHQASPVDLVKSAFNLTIVGTESNSSLPD